MVEILAVQFFSLNLELGASFDKTVVDNDWDPDNDWFSFDDKDFGYTNFAMVCFEKASCWDEEKKQHNFMRLLNGTRCKSVLRIVTEANMNLTSGRIPQFSNGM